MEKKPTRPTVIDLYAGVGGMSLGAARAGFDLRAAIELDPIAIATHAINFPQSKHLRGDVSKTSGDVLSKAAGLEKRKLDALVGGPPCQGFSNIGKRAANDPRNTLFADFFRLVDELRPRVFVAENVPGILAERNAHIVQAALARIPSRYILLEHREVAANSLGAPTSRARVFFVGYDPDEMDALDAEAVFRSEAAYTVTVGKALAGMPTVRCDWQTEEKGWRKVDHAGTDQDDFHRRLNDAIPPGVGDPHAIKRLREAGEVSGNLGTRHIEEVVKRFTKIRPGETDPVSRAHRLAENGFCPTLRAGTGADRGSFQAVRPIHFKSPRVITPREAARLQGFPDWFQFHGTKWHSFRQIGNSVSPIVSEFLLSRILTKLV